MAHCMAAGKAIADMITGKLRPDQFVQCFLPQRFFNGQVDMMDEGLFD